MITLTTGFSSLLLPWAAAVQDQITTPPASKPLQIISDQLFSSSEKCCNSEKRFKSSN
jgi:hypothetical protein